MTIYLIRHGQTTGDIEELYGGDYDDHLTDLGTRQSVELARRLDGKRFDTLFASPLLRAQETARIIGEKFDLKPSTLLDFKERNRYGVLTGNTKGEAKIKFPDQVVAVKDMRNTIDGAEPYVDFQHRITEAMENLSKRHFKNVAVVTHGGPIRFILSEILKLGDINAVDVDDCGFIVLKTQDGDFHLREKYGITLN